MKLGKIAFIGDYSSNRVIVTDIEAWTYVQDIIVGDGPYPVDRVQEEMVLASTRKEQFITPIDLASMTPLARVGLSHSPRSTTLQASTKRVLVGGGDRVMTTVLDVSGSVPVPISEHGPGTTVDVTDFGGRLASGHPDWLDDKGDRFFMMDRVSRRIQVYAVGSPTPYWTQNTPTSVHDIFAYEGEVGLWYAVCEGSRTSRTPPALLEIREDKTGLKVSRQLSLPVDPTKLAIMGGHHCDRHPDGVHIYFGSAEGLCYVIDRVQMKVVKTITTGKSHGHTRFDPSRDLAITTNHDDTFVSVIDASSHTLKKNIEVAFDAPTTGRKLQGHTSTISSDEKYFVHTAPNDGMIYRIDLDKLELVDDRLHVGGYPIQGAMFAKPASLQQSQAMV